MHTSSLHSFFFFNDTATTEIYTLSLHDALPISARWRRERRPRFRRLAKPAARPRAGRRQELYPGCRPAALRQRFGAGLDRKSTRLNSSHANISYAVFCLKKKKKKHTQILYTHDA